MGVASSSNNLDNEDPEREQPLPPKPPVKIDVDNKVMSAPEVTDKPQAQDEEEYNDVEENQKLQRTITLLKLKANNLLLANQIADWKLAEKTKELRMLRDSLGDFPLNEISSNGQTQTIATEPPTEKYIPPADKSKPHPVERSKTPSSSPPRSSYSSSRTQPIVVKSGQASQAADERGEQRTNITVITKADSKVTNEILPKAEAKKVSPKISSEYKKGMVKNTAQLTSEMTTPVSKGLVTPFNSEAKKTTPPNSEAKPGGSNKINESKLSRKPSKSVEPSRMATSAERDVSGGAQLKPSSGSRSRDPFQSPSVDEQLDHAINYNSNDSLVNNVREQLKRWKESPAPEGDMIIRDSIAHSSALSPEHILLEEMAVRETVADSAVSWERPSPQMIRTPQRMSWREEEVESPPTTEIDYEDIVRVESVRGDGRPTSFAGIYKWDDSTTFNDYPTWKYEKVNLSSPTKTKVYVLYCDNKGRWAVTLADRMTANRNFCVTEAHTGQAPHEMSWGVIENDVWKVSDTKVVALTPAELEVLSRPPVGEGAQTMSPSRLLRNQSNSWREDINQEESQANHYNDQDNAEANQTSKSARREESEGGEDVSPARTEVKAMAALWMKKTKAHAKEPPERPSAASKLRKNYSVGSSNNK